MQKFNTLFKIIKGFFLGIFLYLEFFLLINLIYSKILNIYSINFILIVSLFLGQYLQKIKIKNIILYFIFLFLLGFLSFFIFKYINGYSVDGNTYHLEAVIEFLNGKSLFFDKFNSTWLNYYPKNIEIIFSGFVSPFTNYDFGRFFKLLLIIASFTNVCIFLLSYKDKLKKIFGMKKKLLILILTGIIVLNPVVIYQFFTLYIDDILYLLFINFGVFLFRKQYFLASILFFIISGAKFTYIIYSVLLFFVFIFSQKFQFKKNFYKIFTFKNIIFILFGLFIGFHQYILNFINKANPLYPLVGKNKIDIVSGFFPDYFKDINNFHRFVDAFSSYSYNGCYGGQCWHKMNFTTVDGLKKFFVSYKDLFVDTLGNGFGNIFFILLVLSLFIFVYFIFYKTKTKKINKLEFTILFIISCILVVILIIPSPWARYYPFVYLLPLIILFLLKKKFLIKKLFLSLYLLNLFLVLVVFFIFHINMALNKYREIVWINNSINKVGNIYYTAFYKDALSYKKLIKLYNFNENKFFVVKNSKEILKKCNIGKKPNKKIIYCKNGIFIYPNYSSYLGEYMFLEYK